MDITDYPLTLTATHVAEIFGVSKPKAYDIIRRKDFPSLKDGNRVLIPRDAFWSWYNSVALKKDAVGV
ncbi:helix-turn-helix domain-containing protein [Alicyclobacillus fastidiosus]|uniref:Helix-turn-helix domain-containing protein n=1 Tax=Alicyclobacillus fastidiosus TaxID=392011 RepID=A0ABY6ZKZ1_9BACL|nr:helix-turn-helix domain-containing protein [Alicyclobacillus fastidiosus]WAH43531.1 helix-turn-helix domain-containing protein [Alicyclobacillus fastidiosus]GMA59699.1 hypothetical protein GCM10025859_01390 [Alicyclobacillus fastidiosus]GMA65549.1 hypothetical protein GCM10025859_59890 [Alicyclobacillus fastidiosus]